MSKPTYHLSCIDHEGNVTLIVPVWSKGLRQVMADAQADSRNIKPMEEALEIKIRKVNDQ